MPYPYLDSWTGLATRPEPGALKTTGEINRILLGTVNIRSEAHRGEARKTYSNLMREFAQRINAGKPKGPVYRGLLLEQSVLDTFVKDRIYVCPCFEAYSLAKLEPGNGLPVGLNTRFIINDADVPGVDLQEFNPQQAEVLVRPGTLFSVTAWRTSATSKELREVGLTYIGNTGSDDARAVAIAKKFGID